MSMQDPIADMITCIRNGQFSNKIFVIVPFSRLKENIVKVLKFEGYIINYKIKKNNNKVLKIFLKYFNGKSVIENIKRISRPSLRRYCNKRNLPIVMNNLGIAIISTSRGVMTDRIAREKGLGGEIICYVD
ncbi:30S ribosomal protein S8 [Buchnera aphidicola]|uniref:Small ribosomal subunit protein uS8 n=1 Tax=Buchnera aphidicola subsp. Cinara cedri (strain Cc) TaxID=372461 RepID=RS8_BUCCC|nr:30S ribosomal protein S8 [Buchnera aphidicola]Q057B8.1 RecName: Full=Small ribosomal subunit protein uS8; AltName: Full=30S ribosomal protein S8 [Buchnera aphidicola BCc]ABJ90781.1 30S ribosomal protein S8 [Buchnera aphidicola BCc]